MTNIINAIYPYKWQGLWVFDDETVGLKKEPFISGADRMIDQMVQNKGLINPENGFRLIFSGRDFPNYDIRFDWVREGDGGNWYKSEDLHMEGWLCPALLRYFDKAPKHIFARFENKLV